MIESQNTLSSLQPQLSLGDYWHILVKRKRILITFFLVVVTSTFFYSLTQPKIYQASTKVLIEKGSKNILSFQDVFSVDTAGSDYYKTQHKILKSRTIAKKVINHLNLSNQLSGAKDPTAAFLNQIDVEPVKQSRLVDVKAFSQSPQQATDIANALVRFYVEQNLENKLSMTRQATGWLELKIKETQKKLSKSESQLQEFKEANQGVDFASLETSESFVNELQLELAKLKTEFSALNKKYLPKHPKVIRVASQISGLEDELNSQLGNNIEMGRIAIQFNQFKREVESNRKIYETMLSRLNETVASEGMEDANVIVVDVAEVPTTPVSPRIFLNIFLSIFVGLFGGGGLALFFENLDNTIKSTEDIEKISGIPVLGVIAHSKMGKGTELIVNENKLSSVSESFRAIRTALLFSSPDKPLRALGVTSLNPQEGKTLVASNLAVTIAQSGAKVIIIDADMRRPRLHKVFKQANIQGLSNALTADPDQDISEFVYKPSIDNLSVMFCGPIPPMPAELIGSKRMIELIDKLKAEYDYVIFDSPPFLAVTDPVVLSTYLDGTILITRYNKTQKDHLLKGKEKFLDVKAHILGVVLNDMNFEQEKYKYSTYSYQYGGYAAEHSSDSSQKDESKVVASK